MEPVFGGDELDPDDPGPRLRKELELRARWLSTLEAEARTELVNTPIAVVEERFAAWRCEHHSPEGVGAAEPGT